MRKRLRQRSDWFQRREIVVGDGHRRDGVFLVFFGGKFAIADLHESSEDFGGFFGLGEHAGEIRVIPEGGQVEDFTHGIVAAGEDVLQNGDGFVGGLRVLGSRGVFGFGGRRLWFASFEARVIGTDSCFLARSMFRGCLAILVVVSSSWLWLVAASLGRGVTGRFCFTMVRRLSSILASVVSAPNTLSSSGSRCADVLHDPVAVSMPRDPTRPTSSASTTSSSR